MYMYVGDSIMNLCVCVCVCVCVCCVCVCVCVQRSGDCSDCQWLELRSDWVELSLSALCYLAAEVGGM